MKSLWFSVKLNNLDVRPFSVESGLLMKCNVSS